MDIAPYQSVGPLDFGMTPDEVAEVLGAPDRVEHATDIVPGTDAMADLAAQFPELAAHLPAASEAMAKVAEAAGDSMTEFRTGPDGLPRQPVLTYQDGRLTEVEVPPGLGPLILGGIDLLGPDRIETLRALADRGHAFRADADLLLVPEAGVAMAPLPETGDRPSITVFARGVFETETSNLPEWTPPC